jgi:cell division protease FtsH
MDTLHRLSAALLEREILDAEEIDKVMKGEALPPFEKSVNVNGEPQSNESTNGSDKGSDVKNKPVKKD